MVRIKDLFSKETVSSASKEYIGSILFLIMSIIIGTGVKVAAIHNLEKSKGQFRKMQQS